MTNLIKLTKAVLLSGGLITCCLIFNACTSSKYNGRIVQIKKWVNWQIEFKNGISEADKALAVAAIEKHIIDQMYGDKPDFLLLSFKFTIVNLGKNLSSVDVNIGFDNSSTSEVSSVKPHGGPHHPFLPQNIRNVINVSELSGN